MAKLYFYYAAMNAGKSTVLLQSSYNYQERGMDTLIFTPQLDDRYGVGKIASRIGLSANAISFDAQFDFFAHVEQEKNKERSNPLACVLVDEAQFLKKHQVRALFEVADKLKLPVLCYGLRTDFLGEPFEGSLYLLAWAQELEELKTICHCGRKATMNARVDGQGHVLHEGAQIEIGGNDRYVALCHRHYREGNTGR